MTTDKEGKADRAERKADRAQRKTDRAQRKTDKEETQQLTEETNEVINKTPQNDMGGAGAGLAEDEPVDETVTANDDADLGDGAVVDDVPPVADETPESGGEETVPMAEETPVSMKPSTRSADALETPEPSPEPEERPETPAENTGADYAGVENPPSMKPPVTEEPFLTDENGALLSPPEAETGSEDNTELTPLQKAQTEAQTALDKYNALAEEYNALSPEEKNGEKGKALEKQMADALSGLTDAQAAIEAAKREEYINTSPEVVAMEQSLNDMTERYNSLQQALEEIIGTKTKEDDEKTERDKWRTFWSGIGEIGSSLVNQMGVSGVFGGRNAYGRGAYSSMMKFNLTTKEFSDQADAAHEKRQKAIDDLEKQRLSLQEKIDLYLTQGAATLGQLKATRGDAYDKAKADAAKAERDYELALKKLDNDKDIAAIRAAGRGSRGSNGSNGSSGSGSSNKTVVTQPYQNWYGGDQTSVTGSQSVIEKGLSANAQSFSNGIAGNLGYATAAQFAKALKNASEQKVNAAVNEINQKYEGSNKEKKKSKEIAKVKADNKKLTEDEIIKIIKGNPSYKGAVYNEDGSVAYRFTDADLKTFIQALSDYASFGDTQLEKAIDEFCEGLKTDFSGSADAWSNKYGQYDPQYGTKMKAYIESASGASGGTQETPAEPATPIEPASSGGGEESSDSDDPDSLIEDLQTVS